MIQIQNVSKRYGENLVVNSVSLQIQSGGLTSIIGPNGAGKSTLLSMISRLLPIGTGSISIDNLDVAQTAGDILARRISILRQDNSTVARLTVRDLVAFGRFPHSKGRLSHKDHERIDEAIDYLELGALAGRFIDELSGGQRQRAFVAMVLCQDTDYALFDEPLNNLDIKHSVSMMRLLRRACDELGKTVVVVLHDINFASCYSDTIVAMREGRVFRQGRPDEIIHPEVLEEIYATPFDVQAIAGKRIASYFF